MSGCLVFTHTHTHTYTVVSLTTFTTIHTYVHTPILHTPTRHLPGGVLYDLHGPSPTPHAYSSESESDDEEGEEGEGGGGSGGGRRRRKGGDGGGEEGRRGVLGGVCPWRVTVRFHDAPLDQASVWVWGWGVGGMVCVVCGWRKRGTKITPPPHTARAHTHDARTNKHTHLRTWAPPPPFKKNLTNKQTNQPLFNKIKINLTPHRCWSCRWSRRGHGRRRCGTSGAVSSRCGMVCGRRRWWKDGCRCMGGGGGG